MSEPINDLERNEKMLAEVKEDPSYLQLPDKIKDEIESLFLPPPPIAGDLTGQRQIWSPQLLKLEQQGNKEIDGSRRQIGRIYGREEFPEEWCMVPLAVWFSREKFGPMDSDQGMICQSMNGNTPSKRIGVPKATSCWECRYNATINKAVPYKDKCRVSINVGMLTLPPARVGIHRFQFYGMNYMAGQAIHNTVKKYEDMLTCMFHMGVTDEKTRQGKNVAVNTIRKIETTPLEFRPLLVKMQERMIEWVKKSQEEAHLERLTEDPFAPADEETAETIESAAADDDPLT